MTCPPTKTDAKASPPPSLSIDWDAYLPFFEDEDVSEEDKRQMIEALWSIMVGFVDLGFGIHPIQQACGKDGVTGDVSPGNVLNSKHTTTQHEQFAQQSSDAQQRRSR